MRKFGAIILAAGKGKRLNSKKINKVALHLDDRPMISHTIELVRSLNIKTIVVVVGFAKNSVMNALDRRIIFAEQKKRLGTAHAVLCGLKKLPEGVTDILVLNGDDSAFYTKETIENLITKHTLDNSMITFLTIEREDPTSLGRILRGEDGNVEAIVEEKDATEEQKKIKEINPGCYIFNVSFLNKFLTKVRKSGVTGEYYITSLIDIALKNNQKVETLKAGRIAWHGINTPKDLEEAKNSLLL